MPSEQLMYAHYGPRWRGSEEMAYCDIASEPRIVQMYGDGPIHFVLVREAREGEATIYWGWLDLEQDRWVMIYPNEGQYRIGFPYGPEAEERTGRGRTVRLIVEPHSE